MGRSGQEGKVEATGRSIYRALHRLSLREEALEQCGFRFPSELTAMCKPVVSRNTQRPVQPA